MCKVRKGKAEPAVQGRGLEGNIRARLERLEKQYTWKANQLDLAKMVRDGQR